MQIPYSRLATRQPLTMADVREAADRIRGHTRPLTVIDAGPIQTTATTTSPGAATAQLYLACESTQATGSFKARGALNYALYHMTYRVMPAAGVVIAATGTANAALACAWAAQHTGTKATAIAADHCPPTALTRIRDLGAHVHHMTGHALTAEQAADAYAQETGALRCHSQDNMLIAAGAGTLARDVVAALGDDIDTIIVPVLSGTLLSGTLAALERTGIRVVAAEPAGHPALSAALAAGQPVHTTARTQSPSPAYLGSPSVSTSALTLAQTAGITPVTVPETAITKARRALWQQHRLAVEHCAATGLAALTTGGYTPEPFERVVVVLTGGNADPADLSVPESPTP